MDNVRNVTSVATDGTLLAMASDESGCDDCTEPGVALYLIDPTTGLRQISQPVESPTRFVALRKNRLITFDIPVNPDLGARIRVFDVTDPTSPRLTLCAHGKETVHAVSTDDDVLLGGEDGLNVFDASEDAADCLHPHGSDWGVPWTAPLPCSETYCFGMTSDDQVAWTAAPEQGLTLIGLDNTDGPSVKFRYPDIEATEMTASGTTLSVGEFAKDFGFWGIASLIAFDYSDPKNVVPIALARIDVSTVELSSDGPVVAASGTTVFVSGDSLVGLELE